MSRDALVVGINTYQNLPSLKSPSEDAEAIAHRLENYGDFTVIRLPGVIDRDHNTLQVGRRTRVTLEQLKKELEDLFLPKGRGTPDTALFYFSGHGLLREQEIGEERDQVTREGFLATSDMDSSQGNWGICLKWLRELLKESPVKQQIIWLDCCYGGELLDFKENLEEADPRDSGRARDRCFIAASWNKAFVNPNGSYSMLTKALLKGLNQRRQGHWVTNHTLVAFVDDFLRRQRLRAPQRLVSSHFGEPINLTRQVSPIESVRRLLELVRRLLRGWFSSLCQFFRNPIQIPGWGVVFGLLLILLVMPIVSVLMWIGFNSPNMPKPPGVIPSPGSATPSASCDPSANAADISGIDFNHDGTYLATASLDNTVRLLKVNEKPTGGIELVGVDCKKHTDKVGDGVVAIKFSPQGNYLATAGLHSAHLWEISDGSLTSSLKNLEHPNSDNYKAPVVAIDFSPDDKYLATASANGTVKVWDTASQNSDEAVRNLDLKDTYAIAVSFSQDMKYLAIASVNNKARLWKWQEDSADPRPLIVPQDNVTDVAFNPSQGENGKYLATASADGNVQVWNTNNLSDSFNTLPTNTYSTSVSFSPDGNYVVTTSLDNKAYLREWEPPDTEPISAVNQEPNVVATAFSLDGGYLATASIDNPETSEKGTIKVWSLDSGRFKRLPDELFPDENDNFVAVSFHPNKEEYLAIGRTDGTVSIWDWN